MDHAGTKFNSHLQHQSTTTEIASVIFMVYASLQLYIANPADKYHTCTHNIYT